MESQFGRPTSTFGQIFGAQGTIIKLLMCITAPIFALVRNIVYTHMYTTMRLPALLTQFIQGSSRYYSMGCGRK